MAREAFATDLRFIKTFAHISFWKIYGFIFQVLYSIFFKLLMPLEFIPGRECIFIYFVPSIWLVSQFIKLNTHVYLGRCEISAYFTTDLSACTSSTLF